MERYQSLKEKNNNIIYLKKNTTKQILYVDYAGGKFYSWFNSEGIKHKGKSSYEYKDVERWALKNDFTAICQKDTIL